MTINCIGGIWYIPDSQHPYCVFNAQGFDLVIKSPSGSNVYTKSVDYTNQCCPFSSPSPDNPSPPYSSIYWNGIANNGNWAPDGTYYYVVTLKGCGNTQSWAGYITIFDSQARMGNFDSIPPLSTLIMLDKEDLTKINSTENTPTSINKNALIDNQLLVYPNPTKGKINISLKTGAIMQNGLIEIYTLQGKLLFTQKVNSTISTIDVTQYAKGTYLIKLTVHKTIYKQIFVKE